MKKIRISASVTFRISDCNEDLIKLIDKECKQRGVSRKTLISELSEHPLESKDDVKELRKWVKEQGFKTIEKWLEFKLKEEKNEDNSN